MREAGHAFPVIADPDGQLASLWGIRGVPASFVIDAAGRIRYSTVGVSTEPGLSLRLWAAGRWIERSWLTARVLTVVRTPAVRSQLSTFRPARGPPYPARRLAQPHTGYPHDRPQRLCTKTKAHEVGAGGSARGETA